MMWDFLADFFCYRLIPPIGRRVLPQFLCATVVGIAFGVIAAKLDYDGWAPYAAIIGFLLYVGLAIIYAKTHHRRFRRRRFR